jgi:hypothetical protein
VTSRSHAVARAACRRQRPGAPAGSGEAACHRERRNVGRGARPPAGRPQRRFRQTGARRVVIGRPIAIRACRSARGRAKCAPRLPGPRRARALRHERLRASRRPARAGRRPMRGPFLTWRKFAS